MVDKVAPGQGSQYSAHGLLESGLNVRNLGIRHAGRVVDGQAVKLSYLGHSCIRQTKLGCSAQIAPGLHVCRRRDGTKQHRRTPLGQLCQHQPRQLLSGELGQHSGQRHRRGGTSHRRGREHHRDALAAGLDEESGDVGSELERADHPTSDKRDDGPFPQGLGPASDPLAHFGGVADAFYAVNPRLDVLGGIGQADVISVDVHYVFAHVGRIDGYQVKVDIVQSVHQAGQLGNIAQHRRTRLPALQV